MGGPAWPPMVPLLPDEYALRSFVVAAQSGDQNAAMILGWADTQVGPYDCFNAIQKQ